GLPAANFCNLTSTTIGRRCSSTALPIHQRDSLTIQQYFQLFAGYGTKTGWRHVVPEDRCNGDLILTIGRKNMLLKHSAASTERQPFDVVILGRVFGRSVDGQRRCRGLANRQTADFLRR